MQARPFIGYHASHEQWPPGDLLRYVGLAEQAGFDAAMCSDHLQPWTERVQASGYTWSWLGAAMQATSLSYGTVSAPGQRYHPVILAHAAATLASMFPGRLWVALGSGENLNESITGDPWPPKEQRNARLRECVDVMRALFRGETVTHDGLVKVKEARLWTLPETPPLLYGAALTTETARWVGSWADGLITVVQPREALLEMIDAFRAGGGEGKPMSLQVPVSFAATVEQGRAAAYERWRQGALEPPAPADIASPRAFDEATRDVKPEDLEPAIRVSSDPGRHAAWLAEDLELGFDRLYIHNVAPDQERFIEVFGRDVLPQVRPALAAA
jgi:probable non-F420 flavinoid oxidoreductase